MNLHWVMDSKIDIDNLFASITQHPSEQAPSLLALMSVLSQSLFTLVRSHFVALFLFTVWHIVD